MSQILVFRTPEASDKTYVGTIDEKSILYNNLSIALRKDIDEYHFKQFLEMENRILKLEKITAKGVPPIVAKELIKYVKPLVIELPENEYLKKNIEHKMKKKAHEVTKIDKWFITLQNENPVSGVLYPITQHHNKKYENIKYKNIVIPAKASFKMIGCVLPDILGIPTLDSSILLNSVVDDIAISNYSVLLETGSYRLDSISNYKNSEEKVYIQQFDNFEHTKSNYIDNLDTKFIKTKKRGKTHKIIIFDNAEDSLKKMTTILNEVERIRAYYADNYTSVLKTIEFNPLRNLDVYRESIRNKNLLNKFDSKNNKLVSIIKEIIPDEIIRDTEDSIYFVLKNKGKLELFNKLKILGANNSKMQKELNSSMMENEIKKVLEYQNKIRTMYLLELTKKQAITINKFGFKTKYHNLSQINRNAINNEYKKLIEEEQEIIKEKKSSGQKLEINKQRTMIIKNFYSAFNDIRPMEALKYAMKDLKEIGISLDKSTLKYGLCEHNLTKAKMIISGRRDKNIKDDIILKYTHEHDVKQKNTSDKPINYNKDKITDDYYCNICGERIYINIVEDTIKFVEGKLIISNKDEDSLRDLIYKEVSYTIRAVLRFKTPLDTRPIVRSLVDVLRPEIGNIESRLLKIRTNIQVDVRDLIILYISIYTYALLSRIIFINHGEITFAQRPKFKKKQKVSKKTNKIKQGGVFCKSDMYSNYESDTSNSYESDTSNSYESDISSGYESDMSDGYESDMSDYNTSLDNNTPLPVMMNIDQKIGGEPQSKKNRLQNIFFSAYKLLISTKFQIIKKNVTIKPEDIQPLLIKAYQWVMGLYTIDSKTDESSYVGLKGDIVDNIINHPIYNYLYKIKNLIFGTKKEDLQAILGKSIETIEKYIQKYDSFFEISTVSEDQFINYIKKSIKGENKSSFLDSSEYVELVSKYLYFSYKHFIDYASTGKYMELSVPLSPVLIDYYKNLDEIKNMQTSLQYISMVAKAAPIYVPNYYKYKHRFDYDPSFKLLDISKLYRRNGNLHNWNIYVFKKKSGNEKKEFTISELNNAVKNGQNIHRKYILIDRKDSGTGEYLSKIKDYSSEIEKNSSKFKKIENFFNYFDNRCPNSGLHTMDDKKKCKKCGIVLVPEWRISKEGEKYYTKYLSIFEKQLKEHRINIKKNMNELTDKIKKSSKYENLDGEKYDKIFQLNEAKILNWSRQVKIPFNVLINLGLSEGIKFEKIERGEIDPRKDENTLPYDIKTRSLKLDGYYNAIIYQYYLIKIHTSSYDLPIQINELINNLSSSKGLQASMKDIYDPMYYTKFMYFLHTCKDPNDLNKFILNKISETLINITTSMSKTKFSKFGNDLVKYFTNEIINEEKLFSKPDPFKYKIDKRSEMGDEYASDSSNIESNTEDFISTEEFRSSTDIVETASDAMASESSISGNEYNKFGFDESDILEKNEGED